MIGQTLPDLRSRGDLGVIRSEVSTLPKVRRSYPPGGSSRVGNVAERETLCGQTDVARASRGDIMAFSRLVEAHSDLVRRIAVRLVGPDDAQDASQETWIRVWRNLRNFRGDSAFSTWLHRVATNACLVMRRNRMRRRERERDDDGTMLLVEPSGGEADPETTSLNSERREEIGTALRRLRIDHRRALVLRHMEGLSYAEVSGVLGVPVGTAKGWVSRGHDALLVALAKGNGT
ncbi:RNA polymerase sigma factor RpoE [soil metagenome]